MASNEDGRRLLDLEFDGGFGGGRCELGREIVENDGHVRLGVVIRARAGVGTVLRAYPSSVVVVVSHVSPLKLILRDALVADDAFLHRLFLDNDLAEGRFVVGGRPVALTDIRAPILAVGTRLVIGT